MGVSVCVWVCVSVYVYVYECVCVRVCVGMCRWRGKVVVKCVFCNLASRRSVRVVSEVSETRAGLPRA